MRGPVLVVAPHPDDEILGSGATIARLVAEGTDVHVVICTTGQSPQFAPEQIAAVRQEASAAHDVLGVTTSLQLDLPAAALDTVAHAELNAAVEGALAACRPATVLVPFPGDLHRDHQLVFDSVLVAARPSGPNAAAAIYAYETLSETNWNAPYLTPGFVPTTFVDVTGHIETKLQAMACYGSQLKAPPHERSLEAVRALATLRGATVGLAAAEAFVLIRAVV